ncbi:MAG: methyl-accepting chemotaxis protein [Spirochaetales bacterium]|nr:methyl-accepting chemotaxis protein [Spirochaetales bacterium]
MKIRTRISLALMGTGLVATLAFGAVAAFAVAGNARSMADSNLASQLGAVGRSIGLFLDQASTRLPGLAEDVNVRTALGALPGSPEAGGSLAVRVLEDLRVQLDRELVVSPLLTEILLADDSGGKLRAPSTLSDYLADPRQEAWFNAAVDSPENVNISEPRLASSGATTLTLSIGVRNARGALSGALGFRVDATELRDALQALKVGAGGFAILTTGRGEVIANPRDITAVGTPLSSASGGALRVVAEGALAELRTVDYRGNTWLQRSVAIDRGLVLHGFIPLSEVFEPVLETLVMLGVTALALIALALLSAGVLSAQVSRPVVAVASRLSEVADGGGDLSASLAVESKDEAGDLARHFNRFASSLRSLFGGVKSHSERLLSSYEELNAAIAENSASVRELAAGNRSASETAQTHAGLVSAAAAAIEESVRELDALRGAVDEAESRAVKAVEASDKGSAHLEAAGSLAERNDRSADELLGAAVEGDSALRDLDSAGRELAQAATRIQEMTALILNISSRTNLLAMNAAIEAAHAGDAGAGFAVVAEEIRNLADQSSRGAKDIREATRAISGAAGRNLERSATALDAFGMVRRRSETVKETARDIATGVREQLEANAVIREGLSALSAALDRAADAARREAERGAAAVQALRDAERLAGEIAAGRLEERQAMDEQERAMESMQDVSADVGKVARELRDAMGRFRLESEGGEAPRD